APIDRTIAHFLVPSAYPIALGAPRLEVVLHGSDVRLVLALPFGAARHVVRTLLDRDAQFRFVSHDLRARLAAALGEDDRARLASRSRVALPRIEVATPRGPRVWS